ncbi:MAG: hypothetical protein ACRECO_08690 [Xanthobacteraceae bacterium]
MHDSSGLAGALGIAGVAVSLLLLSSGIGLAQPACRAERATLQVPKDLALCASLEKAVRDPGALALSDYQDKLASFLRNFCHRNEAAGWTSDKRVRDTGPFVGIFQNGNWSGKYFGTHAPVVTWYSPDLIAWLKANRPETGTGASAPVPDGAIMVKEMFPPPTARCADVDVRRLFPLNGGAIMVRASRASHDGWFWGWFGWEKGAWTPDWPAAASNGYPNMGFGMYCTNCHASARDNHTFASLRNIKGEPGEPLVFLSQDFFLSEPFQTHHEEVGKKKTNPSLQPELPYSSEFTKLFRLLSKALPSDETIRPLPSETYDSAWVPAGKPTAKSRFVTSDQCLGCHSAGGTGLQFQMTEPGPDERLVNISPYGTWRSSPMGLSGRDPVFFAQLASESETFHPESSAFVQDTCLSCHAVQGHRQRAIDRHADAGKCDTFSRKDIDAVPFPPSDPVSKLARYGALARDGVSCTTCHSMAIGRDEMAAARTQPQNACIEERQQRTNPGLTGLARTFTGTFLVGPPGKISGPSKDLKQKPMAAATGLVPEHNEHVKSAELCASCHTVHLPILHRGKIVGRTYEQATYPEWAFSGYRVGRTVDGALPYGAGDRAQTCQDCHMPNRDAAGKPYRSKVATIQEYNSFPQAEYTLPAQDIDLRERENFAKHTLVGLNLFLIKMAQQFSGMLGIRTEDPMLPARTGIEPLTTTERAILEQAAHRTADIGIAEVARDASALSAKVTILNKTGHKFPSGVAFRRAFIEFSVLDIDGKVLWSSGRTDAAGVIVDDKGAPVAGELWWKPDCSARIDPAARAHQRHFQVVSRQDQAQIYQELTVAPADVAAPVCGPQAKPEGALTTSFLSICSRVKDNRLLPHGFLPLAERIKIAGALGAGADLAEEVASVAVGDDADYRNGGSDSVVYRIPLADIRGTPAAVRASLYYQATPPYFLQDRFCTSKSEDTSRLYYVAGRLDVAATPIRDWKLQVGASVQADVP